MSTNPRRFADSSINSFRKDQIFFTSILLSHTANSNRRLDEQIARALNSIRRPSSAEEITEMLNRNLGAGDLPFEIEEVSGWLRNARYTVLNLYWLRNRPRR